MATSEVNSPSGLPTTESLRAKIEETFDREYPDQAHLPMSHKISVANAFGHCRISIGGDMDALVSMWGEIKQEAQEALRTVEGPWESDSTRILYEGMLSLLGREMGRLFPDNYAEAEKLRKDINFSRENFGILCLDCHNVLNHHQPHSIVSWHRRHGYKISHGFNPKKANTWRFVFPGNVYEVVRTLGKKEAREQLRAIKALDALAQ